MVFRTNIAFVAGAYMIVFNQYSEVKKEIAQAKSLRDALFILKLKLAPFGRCNVAYEFALRPNAYITGDIINMTTLSRLYVELYPEAGGTNSDPVLENIGNMRAPLFVDLHKLTAGSGTRFYKNRFFSKLAEDGQTSLAAYPFTRPDRFGYGVMTIFETEEQRKTAEDPSYYIDVASRFHKSVLENGQIADYFKIAAREIFVLERMARGQTAADIALELGLTVRAIEKRLSSVRKKLRANTTTEAVFKAAAYRILK